MVRTILTGMPALLVVAAVLLSDGQSLAAPPPKGKNTRKEKDAQIKVLQAQIGTLSQQRDAELKLLGAKLMRHLVELGRAEENEKRERAGLGPEEKQILKRIDERFEYVIEHLDPKKVRRELESGVKSLRRVCEVLSVGDFDYGGNRRAAQRSVGAAEDRLKLALARDTREEMAAAAKDLRAAHTDINKALVYSVTKYGLANDGIKRIGEPESRAAANLELWESLIVIDKVQYLLTAVDHDIKDLEHEKKELRKKQEIETEKVREKFRTRGEELDRLIEGQRKLSNELPFKTKEAKKGVWQRYAAAIKPLQMKIDQLRK